MDTPRTKNYEGKQIVCGTDFSENARRATRVATALAKKLDERVCLVHAIEMPVPGAYPEIVRLFLDNQRNLLEFEAQQMREGGVILESQSPIGSADEALVRASEQRQTRFIIVSSLGKRAAKRFFLGSVSERTAEQANVPTLVVRDAIPFEKWARGEKLLKVFVAFNFTTTSEAALRWAKELEMIGPCELVVGHVNWPPEQAARLGSKQPAPLIGNSKDVQQILDRDLNARVKEISGPGSYRLRADANWGRPDVRLAEMAGEEAADLIVVGSHQYRGFERLWHTSVSRGLLHNADTNVAVVPLCTDESCRMQPMPVIRRVLVATDLSAMSNHAVAHAYAMLPNGGTVYLFHVIAGQVAAEFPGNVSAEITSREERLRALVPASADSSIIKTTLDVVEHSEVAEAIAQAAERIDAHVICLSTHGLSGLPIALLGSVTQNVLARTRRPVLIIRPPLR